MHGEPVKYAVPLLDVENPIQSAFGAPSSAVRF